jgi:phage replication-related protein YjqB (UPF0714/DUF867 family)
MLHKHPEYRNFAALLVEKNEGVDFDKLVRRQPDAKVAVLAPHGGRIEPRTDRIATAIAANDFSLYCFLSKKPKSKGNLHITSHNFDDPQCLGLVAKHQWVLTIHGSDKKENGQDVLLGGLDTDLIAKLAKSLNSIGITAKTSGHEFLARHSRNVCNRGTTGVGAQFELSMPFRRNIAKTGLFIAAVRSVLLLLGH